MIIKFYNLGAIKETELDLRPLTVIIGPNNSNKTYIAYSVYGLLRQGGRYIRTTMIGFKREGDVALLQLDDVLSNVVPQRCRVVCKAFEADLEVFYQDSSRKIFSEAKFELSFSNVEVSQALSRLMGKNFKGYQSDYQVEYNGTAISLRNVYNLPTEAKPRHSPELNDIYFQTELAKELFLQQYLLPAERNAFIITYKMLSNRRFSLLRDRGRQVFGKRGDEELQRTMLREQGDIRYPQPIEDFLDFLSDVELSHGRTTTAKSRQRNGQHDSGEASAFAAVASQIEKYIQDGNKTAFSPTTLGGSEIMVNVKKGLSIDLYNASSSIKQLTPLLLYLRYRAAENQLLIIDEPEMNLHPESQVRLLEILAILVNAGVKVLLTTHSPYLMSHLNNLTLNDNHSHAIKKKQAGSLYLKDPRAFLTMEQVSAYEMRDNQLKSLKDDDFGIRYDTLSDVSVDVQQKYFEIYEKGKPAKRGKAQTTRNGDIS